MLLSADITNYFFSILVVTKSLYCMSLSTIYNMISEGEILRENGVRKEDLENSEVLEFTGNWFIDVGILNIDEVIM